MELTLYNYDGSEDGRWTLENGVAVPSNHTAAWYGGIVQESPEQGEDFIRALRGARRYYSRLVES